MTFSSLVIIDLGIARVWREGADADTVKFGTVEYNGQTLYCVTSYLSVQ